MLKEFSDPATSKQIGEHLKHNQIALLPALLNILLFAPSEIEREIILLFRNPSVANYIII